MIVFVPLLAFDISFDRCIVNRALTARDGRDALEKLGNFDADAVITDLNMPNLDGAGLLAGRSD